VPTFDDFPLPPGAFAVNTPHGVKIAKKFGKRIQIPEDGEMPAIQARNGFTFGADPECFVFDGNGKPVAPTMIPGSKQEPHRVPGGAVQRDGMAAEFNVDKAHDFATWNRNFELVITALKGFLPKDYELRFIPSVEFDEETFSDAPDEYKILGCDPDWNAWDGDLNPPPNCADRPFLRTASGHIHIGWGNDYSMDDMFHQQNCFDLVKQLDWWLAGWSLKLDPDTTRRLLYGQAGACRIKPYGVEYRTLSNFWVTSRERRLTVWNRMQRAIIGMSEGGLFEKAPAGYNDKLREAINTGKMDEAFRKACRYPLQVEQSAYASF
jgi:hypothetical protein